MMKQFLKDNLAIAAAVILPLVLVALFFVSTKLTTMTVESPKYDFLVATDYYRGQNNALQFDVIGNKLVVNYAVPALRENYYNYNNNARLWRVRVKDMVVEEIALPFPQMPEKDQPLNTTLDVPAVKNLVVTPTQPGPDGYSFESSWQYRGNIMVDVFDIGNRSEYRTALVKNGRVVPVRNLPDDYSNNVQFIGWITGGQ